MHKSQMISTCNFQLVFFFSRFLLKCQMNVKTERKQKNTTEKLVFLFLLHIFLNEKIKKKRRVYQTRELHQIENVCSKNVAKE